MLGLAAEPKRSIGSTAHRRPGKFRCFGGRVRIAAWFNHAPVPPRQHGLAAAADR
jgi:hypothetical protein